MIPPTEIEDVSDYRRRMNELITVEAASTVVLTVDMQNDYLDLTCGTSLVDPEEAKRVVYHAAQLLDFARSEGLPVIHAYVKRRPEEVGRSVLKPYIDTSQNAQLSAVAKAEAEARKNASRVAGTAQAEVPTELVAPGDLHV